MTIFQSIAETIMRWRGATNTEIELYRLRKNIERDDFKIEDMDRQWSDDEDPCCPSCRFGSVYNEIVDKQIRRREWEKVLVRRIKK